MNKWAASGFTKSLIPVSVVQLILALVVRVDRVRTKISYFTRRNNVVTSGSGVRVPEQYNSASFPLFSLSFCDAYDGPCYA